MFRICSALLSIFFSLLSLNGQEVSILPYLQDVSPDQAFILWETTSEADSFIDWGTDMNLGNQNQAISFPSAEGRMVHQVQLDQLEPRTHYFYQAHSGLWSSDVFRFKTAPQPGQELNFNIVAMSDMQVDGAHPNKFQEIVEEGVLDYFEENYEGELVDNLALVLLPGDLVPDGNNFGSWATTFFNPAEKLSALIPFYPVLGNHENNSGYFFTYFKLPENGSEGLEERWWYKDYGNVRFIGLDSNAPFTTAEQIVWLQTLLDSTCEAEEIDFVFAQLHHPHKSELWTPGESGFTGEVINRLENFTTDCTKPSIHFFGHTHGYSRGQSRDHKHLWINVATAGGAIDNWGEFPNFDYDEFSVSQDEYGFVLVEVYGETDPKMIIKRISRGDQDVITENTITDSLVLRQQSKLVDKPLAIAPVNSTLAPECVVLEASSFSAPNSSSSHGQSHWQISTLESGFDDPVFESWKNFENWYFEVDTQANDDLWDEVANGLNPHTDYIWRVRYRDREMNWSDWSEVAEFQTSESILGENLLENAGAEEGISQWDVLEGVVESLPALECNGVNPNSGERYLIVGGLCEHSPFARTSQSIDLTNYTEEIEAGNLQANFGGYLSDFSGVDLPEMKLVFLDEFENILSETETISSLNSTWTFLSAWADIPTQSRSMEFHLMGTRNAGEDNDCYFDDLFLRVGQSETDCEVFSSTGSFTEVARLLVSPNPANGICQVEIPWQSNEHLQVSLIDLNGKKWSPQISINEKGFEILKGDLANGTYIISVRQGNELFAQGKVQLLSD